MSTFLELVHDLHRECGAAGTAPVSVAGQTGEAQRLVRWIRDGDMYVQNLWTNWRFLWDGSFSQATVAATPTMAAPSTINFWDFETFRINGDPIDVIEYEDVKGEVLDTSQAQPARIIIMPDYSLKFEPVPDAAYTITADHFVKPSSNLMTVDGSESAIPETFRPIILAQGLIFYANYENAAEVKTQGEELYEEYLPRLENSQLPNKGGIRFKPGEGAFEVIAE